MAFNPFRSFRKHQKVIFAVLVVMAMFVFVLTSSTAGIRWDQLFVDFARSVGLAKKPNNTKVAEVDGKKVTEGDLMELSAKRGVVLEAWQSASQAGLNDLAQKYIQQGSGSTPAGVDQFAVLKDPLYPTLMASSRYAMEERTKLHISEMAIDSLLDFIMWQKQADKLGINLSTDDAARLFRKETNGKKPEEYFSQLRGNRALQFKPDDLLAALAEEYRVRLAKQATLGIDSAPAFFFDEPKPNMPAPVTPYDFWEFYRKNRTVNSVAILPIPVEPYMDKVTKSPTENELKSLFGPYKNVVPDPKSDKPAFKEPHRIKLQWLMANSQAPLFQTEAVIAPSLIKLFNPFQTDAYDLRLFEQYVYDTSGLISTSDGPGENPISRFAAPPWNDANYTQAYELALLPFTNGCHANEVAGLVGGLAAGNSPGSVLGSAGAFQANALLTPDADRREWAQSATRARDNILNECGAGALFLAPGPNTSLIAAGLDARQNYYLPFSIVKEDLALKDRQTLIHGKSGFDDKGLSKIIGGYQPMFLDKIQSDDLKELKNKGPEEARKIVRDLIDKYTLYYSISTGSLQQLEKDKVDASVRDKLAPLTDKQFKTKKEFVDELAKTLSADELKKDEDKIVAAATVGLLQSGESDKPRDRHDLASDPNLKPLMPEKPPEPGEPANVAEFFADGIKDFEVKTKEKDSGNNKQTVLYWKTQDIPEQIPTFKEAHSKVEYAWQFMQARKLALEAANKLIDDARQDAKRLDRGTPYGRGDALKNLRDQRKSLMATFNASDTNPLWAEPFEDTAIYLLAQPKNSIDWKPSMPDKKQMPYAPDDFAKLVSDRLAAEGDAIVITNQPGTMCYVLVLQRREAPEPAESATYFGKTGAGSLFEFMEKKEVSKYRSRILHELRLNAGLDTDEQEVDEYGNPKKDAQGRPMVDEFGNPVYKKTYSLNDDQRKKIMGDAGRE